MLAITALCSRSGSRRVASRWTKSSGPGNSTRLLTPGEEQALARRVKAGDQAARDELIVRNMPLAIRMASQFESSGMTFDDLVQEGFCGLIIAAEKFDPQTHGTRFSSYAFYWIIQGIQRAIGRNSSLVRVPDYLWRLQHRLQQMMVRERNLEYQGVRPEPHSPDALAETLGVSLSRLDLLHRAQLERRPPQVGDDGDELSMESQVLDPFSPTDEVEKAEQIQTLYRAIETLPPVEAWVIRRRFRLPERYGEDEPAPGTDPSEEAPRSMDALAAELGVCRRRVVELERSALRRLRTILDSGASDEEAAG